MFITCPEPEKNDNGENSETHALTYTMINGDTEYEVSIGTETTKEIIIPASIISIGNDTFISRYVQCIDKYNDIIYSILGLVLDIIY